MTQTFTLRIAFYKDSVEGLDPYLALHGPENLDRFVLQAIAHSFADQFEGESGFVGKMSSAPHIFDEKEGLLVTGQKVEIEFIGKLACLVCERQQSDPRWIWSAIEEYKTLFDKRRSFFRGNEKPAHYAFG